MSRPDERPTHPRDTVPDASPPPRREDGGHDPDTPIGGIGRVGVVGCGLMGSGIAEVCARAGCDVRVAVSSPASARAGHERVRASLDRSVRRQRVSATERDTALERVTLTTELTDLADRQLVIECVPEDVTAKRTVFAALDRIVTDPTALLASTTSSLSVMGLASATRRPGQVLGIHFFSPAPAIPLVELVPSLHTDEKVYARAAEFVTVSLGKRAIRSPDRTGFVVNALLVPYLLAAIRMVESGFASPETIDQGMTLGCSHPVGPLRLADLIGLDVVCSVAEALYAEFKEPLYAPPPVLTRMVQGGMLGKKTGRGFYTYDVP